MPSPLNQNVLDYISTHFDFESAKHYGVSTTSIWKIRQDYGIPSQRERIYQERIQKLREGFEAGKTYSQTIRELD